jgi:uncharacterized membrane protein YtjA (UPF0391 family)
MGASGDCRVTREPAGVHKVRAWRTTTITEVGMIKWAIIFFIISVIAGFFGFTGVASGTRTIAKVLFFIALIIFLIVLIFGVMLGQLVF